MATTAAGDAVWLTSTRQRQVTYGKRSHLKPRGTSPGVEQNSLSGSSKKTSLQSATRSRPKPSSILTSRTSSPNGTDELYTIESSDDDLGHQSQYALRTDNRNEAQTRSIRSISQSSNSKDQNAAFEIPSSDEDRKRKRQLPVHSGSKKKTKLQLSESPRRHRNNPISSSSTKPKSAIQPIRFHIRDDSKIHVGTEQELSEQFQRDLRTASPRLRTPQKQSNRKASRQTLHSSRAGPYLPDPTSENVTDSADELSRNLVGEYDRSVALKSKEKDKDDAMNVDQTETTPPPPKFYQNAITPKQSQLWMNLLEDDDSGVKVKFSVAETRSTQPTEESSAEVRTISSVVRPRRLVDRMKASERRRRSLRDSDCTVIRSTTYLSQGSSPISGEDIAEAAQPAVLVPSTSLLSSPSQSQPNTKNVSNPELRRTYGGSRSYLSEESSSLEQLLSQPLDSPEPQLTRTNQSRGLDGRTGKSSIFDMDESDDESAGRMKSLHELRASGSTERSKNYMEDLLQDVGSKVVPKSKKYSALLDLCRKLQDISFQELSVQTGHLQRLADTAADVVDPLMGVCFAVAINILLQGPFGIQIGPLLYSCNVSKMLTHLLNHDSSVMRLLQRSRDKFPRNALTAMNNALAQVIASAKLQDAGISNEQLSPQIVGLKALEMLIRRLREAHAEEQALTPDLIDRVLGLLESSAEDDLGSHGDERPDTVSILKQELVFSLLESATLAQPDTVLKSQWSSRNLRLLVNSMTRVMHTTDPEMSAVRKLALRLCLNVANNNPENCAVFADGGFITVLLMTINDWFAHPNFGDSSESSNEDMDELLLALGAAINLAECSGMVRDSVLRNAEESLLRLVTAFGDRRNQAASADSIEASRVNVAYGYLAVLLGNLCQSKPLREVAKSRLPGESLTPLIQAVEEFTAYHKAADRGAGANDVWSAFTERLQAVADSLRGLDR